MLQLTTVAVPLVAESWERAPGGTRPVVNQRIEVGSSAKLELERVYDLAPAAHAGEGP